MSLMLIHFICGCSSSGRAPPCQGGGSEFEPRHPLQKILVSLVRFRPEAPWMSLNLIHLYADVAHLVERHLAKVEVASSSLVIRSIFFIMGFFLIRLC